jgi:hypothetical protein
MSRVMGLVAVISWCVAVAAAARTPDAALSSQRATEAAPQLPTKFTNLQILPKDIAPRALIDLMRSFSLGLDVPCEQCHVGEGRDLSKFDFASDAKPAKATARRMLTMMMTINDELLAGVGEPPPPGTRKVTCFTCHRGTTKPLTAAPAGGGS